MIPFTQFSGAGAITAGVGLDRSGTEILMGTPSTLTSSTTNTATGTTHAHAITNYSLAGTTNEIDLSGASKVLGAAGTFRLSSTLVAPGTLQTTGELTVGTGLGKWILDGSTDTFQLISGAGHTTPNQYYQLPAKAAGTYILATTIDVPAGVDVITCSTAAATTIKTVTVANYAEVDGKQLYIDFTYANTAATPSLTVNSLTTRAIYINGAAAASGSWAAGDVLRVEFDATNSRYHILENLTTRQYYGTASGNLVPTSTFNLGTTSVTFNRASAQQTFTGFTLTDPIINNIKSDAAADLWSENTTTNITMGTGLTSGTLTLGSAAATGTVTLDNSTKAHTLSIGAGVTESAATKTINIGTSGASGSTTTMTIGAILGTYTTSINNILKTSSTANTDGFFDISATSPTGTTRLNYSGYLYATKLYSGGVEVSINTHSHTITASSDILTATSGALGNTYNAATARTALKFYRHADMPTATTGSEVNATKYEGWLYATQFEGAIDGGT